ncbi:MAG: hypothetical protein IT368_10980 [Candidatus Hydrogenedentes bacterium]|nr:hypothetical protein [Candidatus Hydrogenedentota bacterium]
MRRNPHIFGMLAGLVAGTIVLCMALYRQSEGAQIGAAPVLIGAAFAFVVSYGAVGILALFIIRVAERELTPIRPDRRYKKQEAPPEGSPTAPAAGAGEPQA